MPRTKGCPALKLCQVQNEQLIYIGKTPWEKDLTFLKMKKLKTKYFPLAYKIPYCKKVSILFYSGKLGLVVTQGHKQLIY